MKARTKEEMRDYQRRRRGVTKGVTEQGVTVGGVTEKWYPNKPTDSKGRPIEPVILSDGRKWYPKEGVVPVLKEREKLTYPPIIHALN